VPCAVCCDPRYMLRPPCPLLGGTHACAAQQLALWRAPAAGAAAPAGPSGRAWAPECTNDSTMRRRKWLRQRRRKSAPAAAAARGSAAAATGGSAAAGLAGQQAAAAAAAVGAAAPSQPGEGMVLITVLLCTLLRGSKLQVRRRAARMWPCCRGRCRCRWLPPARCRHRSAQQAAGGLLLTRARSAPGGPVARHSLPSACSPPGPQRRT
jgi:hypothetical protein